MTPTIQCYGSDLARRMGRIFRANLLDLLAKVDYGNADFPAGFLHTSTDQHEGTCYYDQVWSRDGGRGLIELARFGYPEEARLVADYYLDHINGGHHWGRNVHVRFDDTLQGYEVCGNALILLGIINTWKVLKQDRSFGLSALLLLRPVLQWLTLQMKQSPYGCLLPCQTEMAGNPEENDYAVYAIYPNYAMAIALRSLGQMAEFLGDDTAKLILSLASDLTNSINALLVSDGTLSKAPSGVWRNGIDGRDGTSYDYSEWDGTSWPIYHWTRQAPFSVLSDAAGYALAGSLNRQVDRNSFNYLLPKMNEGSFFRRYGFVSNTCWSGMGGRHDDTMCGYGQAHFTHAAMSMNHVNAYSLLLDGLARLAYDGHVCMPMTHERNPFILHECFNFEHYEQGLDHTFGTWKDGRDGIIDNPGDEGNLVQMAEGLKIFRMMVGLDDYRDTLVISPKIGWDYDGVAVRGWPVSRGKEQGRIDLDYTRNLATGELALNIQSTIALGTCQLKLGPLPRTARVEDADVATQENETAKWVVVKMDVEKELEFTLRVV